MIKKMQLYVTIRMNSIQGVEHKAGMGQFTLGRQKRLLRGTT